MYWVSGLAIYLVIWWVVLFATLPLGVRTHDEEEGAEVIPGTVSSAPVKPMLAKKFLLTSVLSGAIWLGIYLGVTRGWFSGL